MSIRKLAAHAGLLAAIVVASAATARAHHSQTQYDINQTVTVEGTLTKGSWRNPHALFLVQGKRVGSTDAAEEWTIEGPSFRQLESKGWGPMVSKAGDKLVVEGHPRRDGQRELLLLSVTLADGKNISFKPE